MQTNFETQTKHKTKQTFGFVSRFFFRKSNIFIATIFFVCIFNEWINVWQIFNQKQIQIMDLWFPFLFVHLVYPENGNDNFHSFNSIYHSVQIFIMPKQKYHAYYSPPKQNPFIPFDWLSI